MTIQKTSLGKKLSWKTKKYLIKSKKIEENIDISEDEVHKFLSIFHTLVETVNSEQPQQKTDGFLTDAILQIVNTIAGLLRNKIDTLNIPAVLKSLLKKLKSLFIPQTKDSEEGKTGEAEPENGQNTNETQEASEASRDGPKEQ